MPGPLRTRDERFPRDRERGGERLKSAPVFDAECGSMNWIFRLANMSISYQTCLKK